MGELKGFLESFKEFIWDIVGYMLPGFYCIILLCFIVNNDCLENFNNVIVGNNGFFVWGVIIISYLLGYVIYSLGVFIEKKSGNKSYAKRIANDVEKRSVYKIAKKKLEEMLEEQGVKEEAENANIRDLRSIAMGLFPEQDQKIYTFQFRADISNNAGIVSLIIGIIGLLCAIINLIPCANVNFVIVDAIHVLLYIILIAIFFILKCMRNRFYAISLSLPFSLLCSSLVADKQNHD